MDKISTEFTSVLRTHNESLDQNMFEFRSLESNSFRIDCRRRSSNVKDKSYSEEVKAFIQRVIDRQKNPAKINNNNNFTHVNSSTPFKHCGSSEIDVSGIGYLDNYRRKLMSLNDSDFESMDQDQYDEEDESMKENVEITENKMNENRVKSIKKFAISTPKSNFHSASLSAKKSTKNSRISPHKSARKWKKLTKMKLTRENLCKYLKTNVADDDDDNGKLSESSSFICEPPSDNDEREKFSSKYIAFNTSLDYLTEQLHLAPSLLPTATCDVNSCNTQNDTTTAINENCEIINNDSLCKFTFSQPNTTKTSEASIKNLSQLSVSNKNNKF